MIEQYKEGSDLTIMNCYYQYPRKNEDNTYDKDYLVIVYKDNNTGIKHHEIIEEPEYTYYKTKQDIGELTHNLLFIDKDKVEPITCKFRDIEKSIVENCPTEYIAHTDSLKFKNNKEWFKYNNSINDRNENKKLHTITDIFRSDMSIEDYYRLEFSKKYLNTVNKVTKAYFDIEEDSRWMRGDFPQPGECPINAISLLDEAHDKIVTFLLRDSRNTMIQELEDKWNNGIFNQEYIHSFVETNIGGWKQMTRNKLNNTQFELRFYSDEVELLKCFFKQVHEFNPDFIMGWNSSGFDLVHIIERCYALRVNPEDVMCNQEWEKKVVKHYVDQRNLSLLAERGDYTFISGDSIWIDQCIQFASRRKSKIGSFTSFKLDDIGELSAKVKKLDYHHITNDIGMLPWLDYETFVLYNIFDVIVQKCIENKGQDIDYLFAKCVVNNTSYKKGHRQTVYLVNRMTKEFDHLGFIIGNNINRWNKEPEKFLGALVGDPKKTNSYSKMTIQGIPIWVCENLQDFDYTSLYPSIDLEFNIAPNTQIGRILIPDKVYSNENAYMNKKYSRGGEFIENMVTDNHISFCKRWFHLAGFKEFLEDMKEFKTYISKCIWSKEYHNEDIYLDKNNKIINIPFWGNKETKISPIKFISNKLINPIRFLKEFKKK